MSRPMHPFTPCKISSKSKRFLVAVCATLCIKVTASARLVLTVLYYSWGPFGLIIARNTSDDSVSSGVVLPLPAWSGTLVSRRVRRPSQSSLWRHFPASSLFREPTRTSRIPRCQLDTYGRRAFSITGPTVWNSLPDELRDSARGSDSFKQFLKTKKFLLM